MINFKNYFTYEIILSKNLIIILCMLMVIRFYLHLDLTSTLFSYLWLNTV
jgi:hypothetical protein